MPTARPFAANPFSNDFTVDKNNFGPRAGLSWAVDDAASTVVRASIGKMFEPPLIDFYDNSILNNGDPTRYNVRWPVGSGRAGVPGDLATPAPGFMLPRQSITAVDPDSRRSRRG